MSRLPLGSDIAINSDHRFDGNKTNTCIYRLVMEVYNFCYCLFFKQGKMDYDSEGKSFYDGDWVNNVKHGWGTRQYASGNIYKGMWFNNCRHGEGTMNWMDKDQIYTGNWENGIQVDYSHLSPLDLFSNIKYSLF